MSLFLYILRSILDCEKSYSLFSSKICGEELKTSKHASVTVSVTCKQQYRELLVASSASATRTSRSHAYLFYVLSHGVSRKRETTHSLELSSISVTFCLFERCGLNEKKKQGKTINLCQRIKKDRKLHKRSFQDIRTYQNAIYEMTHMTLDFSLSGTEKVNRKGNKRDRKLHKNPFQGLQEGPA